MFGSIFSRMCKAYTKFCNPSAEERIKGKRMSDDLFTKHKKEDDYFLQHHEGILRVVEEYPLEVLRSMNETVINQLAKKFADLLIISICNYPFENEFRREVLLVEKRISKSDYPLASTFRKQFRQHTRHMLRGDIRYERHMNIKGFFSLIYTSYRN
jgi:hypothetical protein